MPAPHPPEFRQRAVDLARSGVRPIAAIAKELSISESCLRNWRKRVLGGQLHRFTGHTVTRVAVLEAELATVRRQGWAETSEELEIGLNGVAAPIHDATGKVIAAVGASGPSHRLSPDSFPAVAARLVVGAREIGARLGYFEQPSHRE